jgi:osmotically inducible protein OsmC
MLRRQLRLHKEFTKTIGLKRGSAMITRHGKAQWKGNLAKGNGSLEVGDGLWKGSYGFASRFESGDGTNPEELIGAAHAACFSMAFAHALYQAGHEPESVDTKASVKLEKTDQGFRITTIELDSSVKASGIEKSDFERIASEAKANCPVSKALAGVNIQLKAAIKG